MKHLLYSSVAAFALGSGAAWADFTLHVLHTNDLHSRIESINKYDSTCNTESEAKGECFGGVARLSTKIKEIRDEVSGRENEGVILLDAGDQYQGSLFYIAYKGKDTAAFMTALGYNAMALGNHEFDDGPAGLLNLVNAVQFPVLSGNLDLSQSPELKDKIGKTAVIEVAGQKIGIVSALATDTPETSSPGKDVIFQDDIESIKAGVETLKEQGVDKIIALTHVGYLRDQDIAKEVPELDAVVGGHSHTLLGDMDGAAGPYPTMVGDVPVVTAGSYSKYLGHLILTFDDQGHLKKAEGAPILLDASVVPDPETAKRVADMAAPIKEKAGEIVANINGDIDADHDTCRAQECIMGDVVADAMLDRVKNQGIKIAIQNGGGLRASIRKGDVTMGDVYNVLPFQNTLATFEASGATVLAALENGVSQVEEGAGRFPQVAGLKYSFDPAKPAGQRISDVMVKEGTEWVSLNPSKTYGIVTNNYLRNGGDGFNVFETGAKNAYDFGPDLAEVLVDYIRTQPPGYAPQTDGRITRK